MASVALPALCTGHCSSLRWVAPAHNPRARAEFLMLMLMLVVVVVQGMGVAGSRAATCEELAAQLAAALERAGPSLIEAVL